MEKNNSAFAENQKAHNNPVMLTQKRPGGNAPAAIAVLLFSVVFVAGLVFVVSRRGDSKPAPLSTQAAPAQRASYGYQNPSAGLIPGDVPKVAPGSLNTKIFGFNVTSPTGRSIVLQQFNFNLAGYFGSLSNFRLMKNGVQVGDTVALPGDYAGVPFRANVLMPGRTTEYFELRADVGTQLPPRPSYGYPPPPVFVVLLQGINYSDSVPSSMDGLPLSLSVPISATVPAQLNATLAPTTPPEQSVKPASTKVMAIHLSLSAGAGADVVLDQLSLGANMDAKPELVANIRVYDGDVFLAEIPKLANKDPNGYWGTAIFPNKLTIAKGTTKILKATVDLPTKQTFKFRLGMVGVGYVGAVQFTGQLPLYGNLITVGETAVDVPELSVVVGSNSPASRMVFPGDQKVDFSRVNLAAGASQKVVIDSITVALDTNTSVSSVKNIRVMAGDIVLATIPALTKNKAGYFGATVSLTTPLVVAQGSTKQLSLYGDVISPTKKGVTLKLGVAGVSGPAKFKVNGVLPVYGNIMTVGVIRVLR